MRRALAGACYVAGGLVLVAGLAGAASVAVATGLLAEGLCRAGDRLGGGR